MSVNLSVRQFSSPTLLADVDHIVRDTGIDPTWLKLEITESAIMENAKAAIALTEQLRSRQIKICIDDFGTGYSSLGYLNQFPVDNLKIDRSFISSINSDQSLQNQYPVVNTILTLAQQLELTGTAEGIETPEQQNWLRQKGCQYGQGYLFSQPLPAAAIEAQFLSPEETPSRPGSAVQ